MSRSSILPLLLAALLVTCASTAGARTYPFRHFSERNGIPGSSVTGIAQDTSGCIWFATRAGLVRYDGTDWQTQGTEAGLLAAWQSDVAVDDRGGLWSIALNTPLRLSHEVGGRWEVIARPDDVHLGGEASQLALGRDPAGAVTAAVLVRASLVAVWSAGAWRICDLGALNATVYGLNWFAESLYIATSQGLFRLPDPVNVAELAPVTTAPPGPVYATAIDRTRGVLRVIGEGWLGSLTPDGFTLDDHVPALRFDSVPVPISAAVDDLGGIYCGGMPEVFYYHPIVGVESLSRASGMIANGLSDVLVDREGQVWLASRRGVSRLSSRQLVCLNAADGLLGDEVSSVLRRHDGTLVLGHDDGVTIMTPEPQSVMLVRDPETFRRVIDLHEDLDGAIWAAMDRSGLARIAPDHSVRWFTASEGVPGAVYAIATDPAGRFWVGTSEGLFQRTGEAFMPVTLRHGMLPDEPSIRRLVVARDGSLYAATVRDGIFRFADGEVTQWQNLPYDTNDGTYAIVETPDGERLVGTESGLCRLTGGRLAPLEAPEPVITRPVYSLAWGPAGHLWIGTNAGVYEWDHQQLRHLGVTDGICGWECNRDALLWDGESRLWIGTDRGVAIYDPRLARVPSVPLPLWIAGYTVDGQERPASGDLSLSARTRELIVRFRAPAFADESRLEFATCLEGFDADWSAPELSPTRQVRYTNLPAGRYQFRVQAFDVVGRQSPVVSSGAIVVNEILTRRPWFRVLVGFMLLGLAWLVLSLVQGRRYAHRLATDVQERTSALARSEATIRTESQRFATVLDSISDGVLAVTADGEITLGNPAAASLLGCKAEDLTGRKLADLLPGTHEVVTTALAECARREGGTWATRAHCEARSEVPGDIGRDLECSVSALTTPTGPGAMVLAFRDVTERRRLEQEQIRAQKLESLGVLAGGIAHDFNNLLTVTLGNLSLLDLACRDDQRSHLEQMRMASERAQRLTGQLLTFARGGAPQKRLTDLRALLDEVATLALAGTDLQFTFDLEADLWDAEIDRGQFEQVLTNLLINARQALLSGGHIWLVARNVGDDDGRRFVEITVRDDGCGIATDHLERIFEPYYTTKAQGSGLGLAICHSIIARHGGSIAVESVADHGAAFTLRIPASEQRARSITAQATPQGREGVRVLVLDDEPAVRELLVHMLGRLGHGAVAVADGTDAVASYDEAMTVGQPFSAVIMDLTIPGGMGGVEAFARLRERDFGVRAIVASGYSHDPVLAEYSHHGFKAALTKPFDLGALAAALDSALA